MVLDDAVSSSPNMSTDTFRDSSSPTSDFDPYASSSSSTSTSRSGFSNFRPNTVPPGYTLDLSKYPRPIPILGSIFGFSKSRRAEGISHAYASMSAVVQRPLTQPECDSIAYHVSKGAAIHSYGEPVGITAGWYRYNATRAEYRFPFWKPDFERFNRDKLFFLRGAPARAGWDLMRMVAYGGLGGFLGKMIVGSYAATVVAVGQRSDSRMKDIVEKIRTLGNDEAAKRVRGGGGSGTTQQYQQYPGREARTVEDYGGVQPDGDVGNDNSPSATYVPDPSRQARYSSAYSREQGSSSSGPSDSYDFDDASPTARTPTSNSNMGSGSAWDRLRRGEKPSSSSSEVTAQQGQMAPSPSDVQSPYLSTGTNKNRQVGDAWANLRSGNNSPQERRAGSTIGDSFTVSGSEEERIRERERAQREFDEGMERERRGDEFNSRRGGR